MGRQYRVQVAYFNGLYSVNSKPTHDRQGRPFITRWRMEGTRKTRKGIESLYQRVVARLSNETESTETTIITRTNFNLNGE